MIFLGCIVFSFLKMKDSNTSKDINISLESSPAETELGNAESPEVHSSLSQQRDTQCNFCPLCILWPCSVVTAHP